MKQPFGLIVLLTVGCGQGGSFDFAAFAAAVKAAAQSVPTQHCATPFPSVPVGSQGVRGAQASFLAQLERCMVNDLGVDAPPWEIEGSG